MVRILFRPFRLKKWLLLGFCAFLSHCGQGGGGGGGGGGGDKQGSDADREEWFADALHAVKAWIDENMVLFIAIVAASVLLVIAIGLLIAWISSRGKFMFLDGVVRTRGAVREPWREFRSEGNSLFLFRIVLGLLSLLGLAIVAGIPILIALPNLQDQTFAGLAIVSILVGALLLIPYILVCIAVSFMVDVFVIPTMYLRRVRALDAWMIAWRELVREQIGSAALLFLIMLLFGIGATAAVIFATCLTCCITLIPYVGTVLLLPIPVFFAAYALEYIQQFGDDWQFFSSEFESSS